MAPGLLFFVLHHRTTTAVVQRFLLSLPSPVSQVVQGLLLAVVHPAVAALLLLPLVLAPVRAEGGLALTGVTTYQVVKLGKKGSLDQPIKEIIGHLYL